MRKLSLGTPPTDPKSYQQWSSSAIKQIELATFEDVESLFDDFSVTGTFTPTRTLDADTATLSDVVDFLSTFISDLRKRGQNRNYDEV